MEEKLTAIYTRVSTKIQVKGTSLEYQEDACYKMAKDMGVPDNLIKVYREEGFTGEDIDRPRMNELREDIKLGLIKQIIILHPDRLSREMVDRLIVCSEFDKYSVDLLFVDAEYKDTEEGKLFFNIQSSIAQYELALIKKRTKRGTIKSVQNGNVMSMRVPPYGYDLIDKQLVINEKEAPFLKKIYQWYTFDKITLREIGLRLEAAGAFPKRSKIWNASSLQKILQNETYIGKFYYNRRKINKVKGKKTKSGNAAVKHEHRDREEWIEVEVPAIIDEVTFALAQEQRVKNKKKGGNTKREYLLARMLRCGNCGNKYSSFTSWDYTKNKKGEVTSTRSYPYYRCQNHAGRQYGANAERCCAKPIRGKIIENVIWTGFVEPILQDPEKAFRTLEKSRTKPSKEIKDGYDLIKYQIEKLNEERKRVITLFKRALIDEDEMDQDLNKIDRKLEELKVEIKSFESIMIDFGKKQMTVEELKAQVEKLKTLTKEKELSFKTKRKIIEHLFEEIIIKQNGDGEFHITALGVIKDLTPQVGSEEICYSRTQRETVMNTSNKLSISYQALLLRDLNGIGKAPTYKIAEKHITIH